MRTSVGVMVVGSFAAAVCSCGIRHLTDPDAGLPTGDTPDAGASVAPRSGFTVDWAPGTFSGVGIRLVCSSGGDALAYYPQAGGGQARRYHAGSWALPVTLPVWAYQVQATAMSSDGVAIFAWSTSDSSLPLTDNLYLDRLAPDDSWSGRILVGDGGIGYWQDATPPRPVLGFDESGSGFVTWSRIDQQATQPALWPSAVWATHAAPDGTWLTDGRIDLAGGTWSSAPSVLARAQVDAVAAWGWSDGTRARVLVARRSGSQWSAPSIVEDAPATDMRFWVSSGPALAGGRTGDMVVVYQRSSAQASALVSRHSADGVSWSDAEVLAPSGASWFQLVHNRAGGAVVVWDDPALSAVTTTATMRVLVSGAGWTAPLMPMTSASGALLAQHPDGRIVFFYVEGDGHSPSAVVLRRYTPATGWQAAETVDENAQSVSDLCFAGDQLVAAWNRPNGSGGVVGVFP